MTSITIVLLIIFAFTFVPLVIAEFARTEALPTAEDFFLQGRSMSTLVSFFTVYATWVSSFAFMGSSGYFFSRGPVYLTALAWNILFGILFMVVGKRLWIYGKTNKYITPTDFFNDMYGSRTLSILITLVMILFTIPYLQIQLSAGAYLIEIASQGMIPWRISGLVFYLVIIIYLWAGGLRAVAWADIFYGVLVFSGMLFCGFYLADKAGGIAYLFSTAHEGDSGRFVLGDTLSGSGAMLWLSMFITVPIGALMGPQMWLRMFAVGKKRTFSIMPLLISFTAIEYLGAILSGSAAILLVPSASAPDTVIPMMLVEYAPPVLAAILFCCIAAAALSTANAQIHAIAAIYAIDVHKRYIDPGMSERKVVSAGKWAILVFSALAYLMLLKTPSLIIETGIIALGGTAQIIVPLAGAFFWGKSHPTGAIAGLLAGIATVLCATFLLQIDSSYGCLFGLGINIAIFVSVSMLMPQNNEVRARIINNRLIFSRDN